MLWSASKLKIETTKTKGHELNSIKQLEHH